MFELSHTVHLILLQLPFEFQPHNKLLPKITKSMTQSFSSSWKIRHNKIPCFGWKTKILSEMSWASNLTLDSILMRFDVIRTIFCTGIVHRSLVCFFALTNSFSDHNFTFISQEKPYRTHICFNAVCFFLLLIFNKWKNIERSKQCTESEIALKLWWFRCKYLNNGRYLL